MPVMTGTALNNLSYEDLVRWVNLSSGNPNYLDNYIAEAAKYGVDEMSAVEDMASTYMNFYKDGNGAYTITSFNSDAQISSINPVDSNVATISRGNVQTPLNRAKDAITNKLNFSKTPASGSFAQNAAYFLGSVGQAVGCASVGITLGKTIEGALYNANPDFWDSLGLWSINPETWKTISNGEDSWQAGLFNFIYGIDPDTGDGQLYMEQNAFAYMAMGLAQNGIFDPTQTYANVHETFPDNPIETIYGADAMTYTAQRGAFRFLGYFSISSGFCFGTVDSSNRKRSVRVTNDLTATVHEYEQRSSGEVVTDRTYVFNTKSYSTYTYDGKTIYMHVTDSGTGNTVFDPNVELSTFDGNNIVMPAAWCLFYGDSHSTGIDGIDNQEDATLPDIASWDTVPNTLSSLQNQYPDLWDNPLVWDNYQPDGTNPQKVYIPVATPNSTTGTNTQPTSSDSTQTNPQVNPATSTQALIDFLTNVMTQPNPQTNPQTQEETDTQPKIPPQNPVDTGTGETPTPLAPVGSASALWSVYHPTQAQVDSFGAWLWTDNIITQIQQLLQNPMEGIITLHKVFATPVDSGTGTIVVGRLDSQVPSATVTQQYVTVDCGSIDCYEEFGNVFDYSPYTDIALYLPFIGIVPLNVSDVMRSNIHVTYGVDVFTGACLAMVEVSRDGNTINLYQYAGMASVEYPLTGSVHSGLITGLLGVAGSIAATVATGGVGAPAAIAAVGGLASAGTSHNARAGGFSGNAGAMGIKTPYLIIERPQTKVAETFPELAGYPTNYSCKLNECSGHVIVKHVHIEGINATDSELDKINNLLMSGVIV